MCVQIEGDFEFLYSTEASRFTAKWENVAAMIIDRMKGCKDPTAVSTLAKLEGNGQDRTKTIAGMCKLSLKDMFFKFV